MLERMAGETENAGSQSAAQKALARVDSLAHTFNNEGRTLVDSIRGIGLECLLHLTLVVLYQVVSRAMPVSAR